LPSREDSFNLLRSECVPSSTFFTKKACYQGGSFMMLTRKHMIEDRQQYANTGMKKASAGAPMASYYLYFELWSNTIIASQHMLLSARRSILPDTTTILLPRPCPQRQHWNGGRQDQEGRFSLLYGKNAWLRTMIYMMGRTGSTTFEC
jgi:hypothetical protein